MKPAPTTPAPLSHTELLATIVAIKDQAKRLRPPQSHKPDAFHEDKSELVGELERLEDRVRGGRPGAR